ncbi:MAG TPA: PAS domain S-box protein [Candidatus Dormibacteraeota bacterium]
MALYVAVGERFIRVSEAFQQITGYDWTRPAEIPPISRLVVRADREQLSTIRETRLDGSSQVVRRAWNLLAKDGTVKPVEAVSRSEVVDGVLHTVGIIRDLTSEKAAEHTLARSEAHLRLIVDTALSAVVTMDESGAITAWNRRAESTFGWKADEVVGRNMAEVIIPESLRSAHREGIQRYMATGEGPVVGKVLELAALHRNGHEFPVELSISQPAAHEGGGVTFVGFIRDITDRKRAELVRAAQTAVSSALAAAPSWPEAAPAVLKGLLETLQCDAVDLWRVDAEGSVIREGGITSEPRADGLLTGASGDSAERLARKLVLAGPSTAERDSEGRGSVMGIPIAAGEEVFGIATLRSGRQLVEAQRLASELTAIGRQIGQYIKRTELEASLQETRKELEQQAELNYRLLFEGSPIPMMFRDRESLTILDVNQAAIAAYGYSRGEFTRLSVRDLWMPKPDDDQVALSHASAQPDDVVRLGPLTHRKKDGSTMEVLLTSYAVRHGARPARFVIVEDVTERERLEKLLRQSQRLESLGQLAGGVAHDFNNLLAVILNFAQFAKKKIEGVSELSVREALQPAINDIDRVVRAGESGGRLTHQLLAFARRDVVRARPLDVNAVISNLEPLLQRTIGEHIELVVSLKPGLSTAVMDPSQLEQVTTNLVVNARDAMPKGGQLWVETDSLIVDGAYAASRPGLRVGHYVVIRVSDTGTGMDEGTLRRVFEPFFTTKPKGQGTGLGLATVHGIVNQARGHVSVYSELGVGTRFQVLLPSTDQEPTDDIAEEVMAGPSSATVLLVEDGDDLREIAERILRGHGFQVISAANGAQALSESERHSGDIDLLLTDLVMPGMQGSEVAEKILALRPTVKVLFMSGYAQPLITSGSLPPNVNLLDKPFTELRLLNAVRRALAQPQ